MTKRLDSKTALMWLILRHPGWSVDDLMAELGPLGFEVPTRILVSSIRTRFKEHLRFLTEVGMVDADVHVRLPVSFAVGAVSSVALRIT